MSFTAQEMRSALLISVSADFFSWVESLSSQVSFVETVALSDRLVEEKYDLELVLRWLVLHSRPEAELTQQRLRDFPQFMDDASLRLAEQHPAQPDALEDAFVRTFGTIHDNGVSVMRRG